MLIIMGFACEGVIIGDGESCTHCSFLLIDG